jgi:multiple sugar transport system substrate-binding protein
MNKRLFWLMTLLVVITMIIAGCSGSSQPAPAEEPKEEAKEEVQAEEPKEEVKEEAKAEEPAEEAKEEAAAAPAGNVTELTILWAQWDPADYLQEIANMYEAETGIKVNVVQEPWGSFGDLFFTEMSAQGTSYDMVVGDSQWLGWASTSGHYVELTDFLTSEGIAETVTPATLTYYGEYPTGSGTYWAYPTEGDANGWAYRKDLFEDPEEQAAFKEKYGYDLAPPKNMQ